MKLVIKIFAGTVLTLAIAIGALTGYQTWKANKPVENSTAAYFTLGENGTTIYVIPETILEEPIFEEETLEEVVLFENVIVQCIS